MNKEVIVEESSKSYLEPKPNMEYYYRLDIVWKKGVGEVPIEEGTIMVDVTKHEYGEYHFTCKATGERYKCNYPWSLAEYTPENMKLIQEYDKHSEKLNKVENTNRELGRKIKTLEE